MDISQYYDAVGSLTTEKGLRRLEVLARTNSDPFVVLSFLGLEPLRELTTEKLSNLTFRNVSTSGVRDRVAEAIDRVSSFVEYDANRTEEAFPDRRLPPMADRSATLKKNLTDCLDLVEGFAKFTDCIRNLQKLPDQTDSELRKSHITEAEDALRKLRSTSDGWGYARLDNLPGKNGIAMATLLAEWTALLKEQRSTLDLVEGFAKFADCISKLQKLPDQTDSELRKSHITDAEDALRKLRATSNGWSYASLDTLPGKNDIAMGPLLSEWRALLKEQRRRIGSELTSSDPNSAEQVSAKQLEVALRSLNERFKPNPSTGKTVARFVKDPDRGEATIDSVNFVTALRNKGVSIAEVTQLCIDEKFIDPSLGQILKRYVEEVESNNPGELERDGKLRNVLNKLFYAGRGLNILGGLEFDTIADLKSVKETVIGGFFAELNATGLALVNCVDARSENGPLTGRPSLTIDDTIPATELFTQFSRAVAAGRERFSKLYKDLCEGQCEIGEILVSSALLVERIKLSKFVAGTENIQNDMLRIDLSCRSEEFGLKIWSTLDRLKAEMHGELSAYQDSIRWDFRKTNTWIGCLEVLEDSFGGILPFSEKLRRQNSKVEEARSLPSFMKRLIGLKNGFLKEINNLTLTARAETALEGSNVDGSIVQQIASTEGSFRPTVVQAVVATSCAASLAVLTLSPEASGAVSIMPVLGKALATTGLFGGLLFAGGYYYEGLRRRLKTEKDLNNPEHTVLSEDVLPRLSEQREVLKYGFLAGAISYASALYNSPILGRFFAGLTGSENPLLWKELNSLATDSVLTAGVIGFATTIVSIGIKTRWNRVRHRSDNISGEPR